jgi:hypothetical protein
METPKVASTDTPTDFYAFSTISIQWVGFLHNSNPSWPRKSQDIEALKAALDVRNWFTKDNTSHASRESLSLGAPRSEQAPAFGLAKLYIAYLKNDRLKLLLGSEAVQQFAIDLYNNGKTSRALLLPPSMPKKEVERYESFMVTSLVELR